MNKFDKTKYYLGIFCKRGHDWSGKGESLRYHKNRDCLLCVQNRHREFYKKNKKQRKEYLQKNYEKIKKQSRECRQKFRRENPEKARDAVNKYRRENPEKIRRGTQRYTMFKEVMPEVWERDRKIVLEVMDDLVETKIVLLDFKKLIRQKEKEIRYA